MTTMVSWVNRSLRGAFGAGLLAVAAPQSASAQTEVDLELVLAVDISRSMDYDEQVIQRNGYADALTHSEVVEAIKAGITGQIALTYVEWSGPGLQRTVMDWTLIDSMEAAQAFAESLRYAPINRWQGTSISGALLYSAGLFNESPFIGQRQVIDVSGDGPNNMGGPVEPARDIVIEQGITINGLPIMLNRWDPYQNLSVANLDAYYETCVIGGPGAFMIPVKEAEQFADAIRRKMVLEIAGMPPPATFQRAATDADGTRPVMAKDLVQFTQLAPPVDCLIGEKLRRGGFGP